MRSFQCEVTGLRRLSDALTREQKLQVVTLTELKDHLRIRHADQDALLQDLIEVAYDRLSGPDGSLVGCCLLHERYEAYLGSRARDIVEIPLRPLAASPSTVIEMVQAGGSYAPIVGGALEIADGAPFAEIRRVSGRLWPYTGLAHPRAYRVEFTAGFGTTRDSIPSGIRLAIKMIAGHWYANPEAVGTDGRQVGKELLYGLRYLLGQYMVHRDHS